MYKNAIPYIFFLFLRELYNLIDFSGDRVTTGLPHYNKW